MTRYLGAGDQIQGEIMLEGGGAPEPGKNPLLKVHQILRGRYHWAIILGLLLGGVGGFLGYTIPKPDWTSRGSISIQPAVPGLLYSNTINNQPLPMFDAYVDKQTQLITSQRVIMHAMELPGWQDAPQLPTKRTLRDFSESVQAYRPRGSQMIFVAYTDKDPALAQVGVKAVLDSYEKIFGREKEVKEIGVQLDALNKKEKEMKADLAQIDKDIAAIALQYPTDDLTMFINNKLNALVSLDAWLFDAKRQVAAGLEARAATLPGSTTGPATAPDSQHSTIEITLELAASKDDRLRDLIAGRDSAKLKLESLKNRIGTNRPEVRDAMADIKTLDSAIEEQFEKVKLSLSARSPLGGTRIGQMDLDEAVKAVEAREKYYKDLKDEVVRLQQANSNLDSKKSKRQEISGHLDEVESALYRANFEGLNSGHIERISDGDIPLAPEKDRRAAIAGASSLAGLTLGFGIIALIGLSDRRLKSVADARDIMDRTGRVLGILPMLPDDITDPEQSTTAAFCVHHIRTLLQIGGNGERSNVFAITSAAPQDGKTSLVLSLGLSYATSGAKTLLIDADVIGSGLTHRLGAVARMRLGTLLNRKGLVSAEQLQAGLAEAQQSSRRLGEALVKLALVGQEEVDQAIAAQAQCKSGLLDVLDGNSLEDCIVSAGTANLSVLPLGNIEAKHIGQFSVDTVRRIIKEARKKFDVVLFDTGPLLGSLEAGVVAASVDEVIVAVSRGQQRPLLDKTFERLKQLGARLAGIVFNRARLQDIERSGYSHSMSSQRIVSPVVNGTVTASRGTRRLGPIAQAVVTDSSPDHNSDEAP